MNVAPPPGVSPMPTRPRWAATMAATMVASRLAGERRRAQPPPAGETGDAASLTPAPMTAVAHDKYSAMIQAGAFPIARWGQPADVANAVAMLCSRELAYSTGQVIHVDGGFHLPRL